MCLALNLVNILNNYLIKINIISIELNFINTFEYKLINKLFFKQFF
jgi:hypothetical protein